MLKQNLLFFLALEKEKINKIFIHKRKLKWLRKSVPILVYHHNKMKMGKSKGSSQPEAERLVIEEVKERWVHGNPVTRLEIHNLLRANYETSILSTSCT